MNTRESLSARETSEAGPPSNLDAEQALVGIVLTEAAAVRHAGVKRSHFSEPLLQRIWSVCEELDQDGRRIEPLVVAERLRGDQTFSEFGGRSFLADLIDKAPPASASQHLGGMLLEDFARREAWRVCREASRELAGGSAPVFVQLAQIRSKIEVIETETAAPDDGLITAAEAGRALAETLNTEAVEGRERGLYCGLRCIDRRQRGLRAGHLVTIGGRPSMGKTLLAREVLYGAAARNRGHLFLFLALEMDRREITERALSSLSHQTGDGVAYVDIGGTSLDPEDRQRLGQLASRLPQNLFVDDHSSLSVDDVRRKIWALRRRGPVGAVVIDYLQLMTRPNAQGRNDASVIGEMTSTLKRIAKETGACIILLSQLSRAIESRDDKRPQLSDLRESGSIEQDANAVLFPYRPAYYTERSEPTDANSSDHKAWEQRLELERRRLDVITAKVRGGAIGVDRQECFIEFDYCADAAEDIR